MGGKSRALLLVLLAIFTGSSVGGLLGALVAIPLTAVLKVLVVELVAPAVRQVDEGKAPD